MENLMLKERRKDSRVMDLLGCNVTYKNSTQHAVVLHLTFDGALILSKMPVPVGSKIEITIQPESLEKSITLNGEVIRSTIATTDIELKYRSVIHFYHSPVDLLGLAANYKVEMDQYGLL